MAYVKQNFVKGQILTAEHMNHIEDGIVAAADAQSLGGKAPEYYLQPRNLLDNSDFRNPVNQRGATEYSGNSYGIDRWCGTAQYQTVSIQNNYITISATGLSYCGIRQKLENMGKLSGKIITFAAQIYSSVGTYIAFMDESGNSIIHVDGVAGQKQILVLTYAIPSNATSDNVVPTIVCRTEAKGDSANIYWAALYEGSYTADTLPPYVPKGYAAELAECQRYYEFVGIHKYSTGRIGEVYFDIQFTQKRINPTVIVALETASNNITNRGEVWNANRVSVGGLLYYANDANMSYWYGSAIVSADL